MASLFFDCLNVYFFLASALALLWYYSQSTYNYWRKLNVKFLKPIPFLGNTASFVLWQKTYHETIDNLYNALSDEHYGGIYELRDPVFLVKNPELASSILVTNFKNFHEHSPLQPVNRNRKLNPLNEHLFLNKGERWRILHQKMRPFFSPVKMKQMYDQISYCVGLLTECIDSQMNGTGSADVTINPLVERMAIDVIGTCAFGIECHSLKSNDKFVKMCTEFLKPKISVAFISLGCSIFGERLLRWLNWRDQKKEENDFFVNLVFDTIQYRRQNNIVRNDLLQLFMNLQNSYTDPKFAFEDKYEEVSTDERFDEIDIAANTFLSFVAGYHTTSTIISFCLYEIALNENIQQRLHSEIKQIHDKYKTISYDSLKEMHYLDAVISETLRKYPSAICLYRKCTNDFVIPSTKARIPAGIKVIIPIWSIHHDSRNYPDPEVFDPERFIGDEKHSRPNGVYLPFGDGPRQCIGKYFGETLVKTALSIMILKYDIKPCSRTEIPLTFRKGTILMSPTHGIWLNLSKRNI